MLQTAFGASCTHFGKFIHQFQHEIKILIRKLKRILNKLYRQNLSLLFNEIYIRIYIYLIAWIHICNHWFHAFFIQQSSA